MKRIARLLALLFLLALAAWLAQEWWQPFFRGLSDEETSNKLQGFEAILSSVALIAAGIAAFLRFRPGSPDREPVQPVQRESAAWQEHDPSYEPTPLLEGAPPLDKGESPYVGLSAFQQEDARLFFGRHREAREGLAWLGTPIPGEGTDGDIRYRWLQIEGNSGAGKSSLVNAGMLPLIDQGALAARTGFDKWRIVGPMMPGEQPLRRLAEVLEQALVVDAAKRDTLVRQERMESDERALAYLINDRKTAGTGYLLVVDQFEELFTFSDREERRHFDRQLAYALQDRDCPLFLINTVRIDYLEGFEHLPRLSALYNSRCRRYLLKTITREGLREAIERPAALVGLDVSEVTAALLRDAGDEIGALPLVENALQYLWEQRERKRLSGALYAEKGGIAGLLELQADVCSKGSIKPSPTARATRWSYCWPSPASRTRAITPGGVCLWRRHAGPPAVASRTRSADS